MLLELLGLKYEVVAVDITSGAQKEDWFIKMNPSGSIPTLVDHSTGITINESAAIMTYLTDTYDKDYKYSFKPGTPEYYKQLEILYFQMSGIGPMQGQAYYFKYGPEKVSYGITRFTEETKRLYGIVNEYLKRNEVNGPYLVGNHYSIADLAVLSPIVFYPFIGIDVKEYPLLTKWAKELVKIPEIVKGFTIPLEYKLPEF